MMTATFDFTNPHSRLDTLLKFIDHWLGSQPADETWSNTQRDLLLRLGVPEPLRRFHACTSHRQDEHGSWIWQNTIPQLLQPDNITPAQHDHLRTTDDWLTIGHYLGECEVLVPQMPDNTCVVEIDGEQTIYHDSLSDFLVRLALRHIATSRPRWKPIAGYEKIALVQLAAGAPSWDVSWRQSDPRGTSGTLYPPFNPTQQTVPETVWLLEGGDVLAYQYGDDGRVTLSARKDLILDQLLAQYGLAEPIYIELKLGKHEGHSVRHQWTLRIAADGSARMTLQIPGTPSAAMPPRALDIITLAKQIASTEPIISTASPSHLPSAAIVRGPNDNGTRYSLSNQTAKAVVSAFLNAVQDRTPEFELAWQAYHPPSLT